MTEHADPETQDQDAHQQFVDALHGLFGADEADGLAVLEAALAECNGDMDKTEALLSERFEGALQEIYEALETVVPERMPTLLAYDLLCERLEEGEK